MLTRILQYHLGVDFYGYWTLLWAVFGYATLLEFGFGRTMQKYAAEGVDTPERLLSFNRIFSAVLASYLGIALALLAISALLAVNLESIFRLPEGNTGYYRTVFWVFGIGCAVVFPTGICTEILAGMHKIHWRNWVIILNQLFELAGIWLTFRLGGSLLAIAVFTCVNNLFSNIVMAAAIRRRIPGIRFTFSGLSVATFRRIADFSVFSYLMSIAGLVIFKTDRVVLGVCSGIAAVAVYQFGTRIPELFQYFTGQLTETMGPTASRLYLRGEHEELRPLHADRFEGQRFPRRRSAGGRRFPGRADPEGVAGPRQRRSIEHHLCDAVFGFSFRRVPRHGPMCSCRCRGGTGLSRCR